MRCKVIKFGRCFDVSPQKPFKHCKYGIGSGANRACIYADGNSYTAQWLEKDTRSFAKLALDHLKAGTAKDCKGNDALIAQNLIKAY